MSTEPSPSRTTTRAVGRLSANPNPIDEATRHLVAHLAASPAGGQDAVPFPLDREQREAEFRRGGCFEPRAYLELQWTLRLDSTGLGLLYEGFSPIARLPEAERRSLIDQVRAVADQELGGIVDLYMTSVTYLWQRR